MKNGVECYKDFFPYFKALKTNCESGHTTQAQYFSSYPLCERKYFKLSYEA